jgi:hypothetical protein
MPVLYSEHLTGDGQEMFEHAAKLAGKAASPSARMRLTDRSEVRPG